METDRKQNNKVFLFVFISEFQVQGKDPSVDITQDVVEESEDDRFEDMPDAAPPIELPQCDLSKLEEISELFNSVLPSPIRREKLSVAIETENYIKKLIDLFHMCEDLDNIDGLHHLYDIFKSIFLLNKNALFEIMFADDVIFDVVGILEYDSSLPQPAKHREYLQNTSRFKEVIPITNTELRNKIHQTYRVQYIQDVILPTPSVFEENMLSTLSSFIFFNKVEIVTMIQVSYVFYYCSFSCYLFIKLIFDWPLCNVYHAIVLISIYLYFHHFPTEE